MVTLVVNNADFSGAPISGYSPPVPGATLAAFVGDPDAGVYTKNFGSGADLVLAASVPQYTGDGFRSFTHVDYLISDAFYTPASTLMAVMRRSGNTDWQLGLSSERDSGGAGNRRGLTLRTQASTKLVSVSASGNAGAGRMSFLSVADVHVPRCLIGTAEAAGTGTSVQIYDLTENRSGVPEAGSDASTRPAADEASNPFRVGANYVGTPVGVDIAFVAAWPFVLTGAQRSLMHESVRRRMQNAYGVTV